MKAKMKEDGLEEQQLIDSYGENVFSLKVMEQYLTEKTFKALKDTVENGDAVPADIADEVAEAMKSWAIDKGATHYTHWFQPLTGATAEKHDAFINPTGDGGVILKFSGKSLVQGEPDASSFPSGGLRPTFEARGYTAWDPTSPAFIKDMADGPTLCIPTAFISYMGEALDKKTPILRSSEAMSKSVHRLLKLFGDDVPKKKAYATLGWEQEYFLIDKEFYISRPDLMMSGRTLFGNAPAKGQQMDDHYFGNIKPRILRFMEDVDKECWRLGIPAKTRHNEVAPAQFELAPVFEELNLSIDHNQLLMEILKEVAEVHGLVCLLHEKPFAGINGSGKHNNWSVTAPDGTNLMDPGDNPHENAKFLTVLAAVMAAVDDHQELLRAVVASAGNDHRLGANEAPPAILSIFLGEQLMDIIEQIEKGGAASSSKEKEIMKLGVTSMPELPKDVTDRNRTSPFAFTGTKWEFRAVGSSQSPSGANVALNTILAQALDAISDRIEELMAGGDEFTAALQKTIQEIVKEHKRILFNGDNYSAEWAKEAEKRGLANIKTTDKALGAIVSEKTIEVFEKYNVLSKRELESRYETYLEEYDMRVDIEGKTGLELVKTMILPAAISELKDLGDSLAVAGSSKGIKSQIDKLGGLIDDLYVKAEALEKAIGDGKSSTTLAALNDAREVVDALEMEVSDDYWPLPKYREMLWVI